jgi:hypothetical protein
VRTVIELVQNELQYTNHLQHIAGPFDEAIRNISREFSFSELYEIGGLSNVLKCKIRSIYPRIEYRSQLDVFNNTSDPAQNCSLSTTICVFWTHIKSDIQAVQNNVGNWTPNHFVPLLLPSDNLILQNDLSLETICSTVSRFVPVVATHNHHTINHLQTPTKLTTKNNVLTRARVPHFVLSDDEREVSITLPPAEVNITERSEDRCIKRSKLSATNCANSAIEKQRTAARERMASKRPAATPEEIEKRRARARDRMASKRAVATPEEIEKQRTALRERMASKRVAATPEEIEKRRSTTRERMASKRAAATPEEIEKRRSTTRERMASKRAVATPEEIEKRRSTTRERMASKRAAATPEEIEKRRSTTRERMASQRAVATPEEIETQRAAARERMALNRSATMLEEIEHQDTLDHQTMASNSTTTVSEVPTACISNVKRSAAKQNDRNLNNHITTVMKHWQTATKHMKEKDFKAEWPESIPIEWKITCLKKFIKQMSMSSLAEGVCGICNVRCNRRDLQRVPLTKIPSFELLKAHDDLHTVLLSTQQTQKVHTASNILESDNSAG